MRNPIADVVKSGRKICYEVVTAKGKKIKATKDHKFYTGTNYVPLSELSVDSTVFVHTNTPFTGKKSRSRYPETTVKFYYKGQKEVSGILYYREKIHRLTYEASLNGLSYEKYKELLNSGIRRFPDNWNIIPQGFEVHHINEDILDNSIENLELIDPSSHARHHALERSDNLRFTVVEDKIISIKEVGEMETYDIKCFFPYNNFIAEGIVVHNSGKTTVCGHVAANCQKDGGKVVYIDGEHALDKVYFQALGVDINSMLVSQPDYGEEGFTVAMSLIESGEVDLVIIDSDSSLLPKSVMEGEIGASNIGKKAKLNSDVYPKIKSAAAKNGVCVIVISQYRNQIGVMFGDPKTTQGGKALGFYADTIIEMSKTPKKIGDDIVGHFTKLKTIKNKTAPPFREAKVDVIFGKGLDKIGELIDLASEFEIIKVWGKKTTYNETVYETEGFPSYLEDNPEFYEELKKEVLDRLKNVDIPVFETTIDEEEEDGGVTE